jgi:phage baseplate assembly protein W|tara:strand:- start:216 stop:683 length:468 start_codon:yes stop_codon:yes gene_type:complete
MPNQRYGIKFPFENSPQGFFLGLNKSTEAEVRSNLIHLILTLKGSRYFLPDFGTNLLKYIYEPLDGATKTNIDKEIRDAVKKFIPGLIINEITVKSAEDIREEEEKESEPNDPSLVDNSFGFVGDAEREYTLRVRIDYNNGDNIFATRDFVIINL